MDLKKDYERLTDEYAERFGEIIARTGEWVADRSIYDLEDCAFNLDEIRFIVDNVERLGDNEYITEELFKWCDYVTDCIDFNIQYINIQSWFKGAPRLSDAEREHIKNAQRHFMQLIAEAQDEYGEPKRNGVPEHHLKKEENK